MLVLDDVELLGTCLDSVRSSTTRPVEVVVVANGTPEERLDRLARDDVVLVRSRANLGFAGGNNLAAHWACGEYLVLVNDDSRLGAGCIDRLVEAAQADRTIGAVGARITGADGLLQEAGGVVWRDGTTSHVGRGRPGTSNAFDKGRDVDYCSANGMLVRRSAWDEIGGLSEVYHPAYYEDVDFCMMLRAHGYRVVYEPGARLEHAETSSTSPAFRAFLMERNRQVFVSRWDEVLAGFEPVPDVVGASADQRAALRAAAMVRAVERSAARRQEGGGPHPAVEPIAISTDPDEAVAEQRERELHHAIDEIRVQREYRRLLEARLAAATEELQRRTRVRRAVRGAAGRLRRALGMQPATTADRAPWS